MTSEPRLWDDQPDSVTHIAGVVITMFGRYMRQRCEWCGDILLEYDLHRIAVPVGQDPTPAYWPAGALVRVDGHMSAQVEGRQSLEDPEGTQLPPDACAFNPLTQVV